MFRNNDHATAGCIPTRLIAGGLMIAGIIALCWGMYAASGLADAAEAPTVAEQVRAMTSGR